MKGMYNLEKRVRGSLKRRLSVSLAVLVFFAVNGTVSATTDSETEVFTKKETVAILKEMGEAINEDLERLGREKAKVDASNIDKVKYTEKLGTGTVAENNSELVTGGTVHTVLAKKANSADVYRRKEAEAIFATREVMQAEDEKIYNYVDSKYKDNETAIATLETKKANKNLGNIENITVEAKTTLTIALGTGAVAENNPELVTGGTVYTKVKEVDDKVNVNKTAIGELNEIKANEEWVKENFVERDTAIKGNAQSIDINGQAIAKNAKDIKELRKDHNRGISQVAAMTAIDFDVLETGEVGIGAGVGSHSSTQSVAVGVGYKPTTNLFLNLKVGVSPQDKLSKSTFGAGAVYKFKTK